MLHENKTDDVTRKSEIPATRQKYQNKFKFSIQDWIVQLVAHRLGDWDRSGPGSESRLGRKNSLNKKEMNSFKVRWERESMQFVKDDFLHQFSQQDLK